VNVYAGKIIDRAAITNNVDHMLSIINDPTISRRMIRERQRIGGRLIKLKQTFGWTALLLMNLLRERCGIYRKKH
jgi:hypothetical protein